MGIEAEFARLGARLSNRMWAVSSIKEYPRELVVSVWDHYFIERDGQGIYEDTLERWKGPGRNLLLKHLAAAQSEGLPLRMVRSTQVNREAILAGTAKSPRNVFKAEPGWVGRVDRLEGDAFRLVFERLEGSDFSPTPGVAPTGAKFWRVADAVDAIGGGKVNDIAAWLRLHHPNDSITDLRENLEFLTVNSTSRPHYDRARPSWRSDEGNPRDRLFKSAVLGESNRVRYDAFNPAIHGHVDLRKNDAGKWEVVELPMTVNAREVAEAEAQAFEATSAIDSDHDARVWALRAVAQRRGQGTFRAKLLEAYGGRCAITGSNATAVLEAAHILPYRGDHTNQVDNGLLLRADIHTLFDLGLLWVTNTMRVAISPTLRGTDYERLAGQEMRMPELPAYHPNAAHLAAHAARFNAEH